jgi:small subunit ribosomal protein S1
MAEIEENIKIVEGSDGYLKEVDGEIVPNYDATINIFNEGDIVTGSVVRIDKDEVLVDIGYKSEGVIPVSELSIRKSVNTADEVTMGEEIDALVMQKEDADGRLILSKKRAKFEKAWKRIEAAHESGEPVQGTVIEVVKGGLILDLGVRGFLPASLVDIRRVQDLGEYVGQVLSCRVIEMNRNRNNVVLSRRAVLEEERKEVRQQIIDELNVGDVVEGTISNIVDFGAFVDLDGIDGLIHISELSWTHINHPSEVLQVNQKVKVKVLDIDRDRQRISLGLKQTQADPWEQIVSEHNIGDVVEGKVTKIVAFGAFVEIYAGIEGLVHISELANRHVERPDEVVSVGQVVPVKVIEIDSDRRRLSLSIKRVAEGEAPMQAGAMKPGEVEEAEEAEPAAEVEVEETPDETIVAEEVWEEEPEPVVLDETPSLGLSDEVFPAGAELAAEAETENVEPEVEAEAVEAEAVEAEAVEAEAVEAEAVEAEAVEAEVVEAEVVEVEVVEVEVVEAETEPPTVEPAAEAEAEVALVPEAEVEPVVEEAEAAAPVEAEADAGESAEADS